MLNGEAADNGAFYERRRNKQLRIKKKFYEFYAAPITKFWLDAIAYVAFLVIYTVTLRSTKTMTSTSRSTRRLCWLIAGRRFLFFQYTVLVQLPSSPAWNEYYIIAYILSFGGEKVREIFATEPVKLNQVQYLC